MKQLLLNIMSVGLYCCLSYPTCKAHLFCAALYRRMQPAWLYHICPQYLTNGTILKKGRQCDYSVIFRRTRASICDVENQYYIFRVCACSISHPACKTHAPYCHSWPVWLDHSFTLPHKWYDFQKKSYATENVRFDFLYNFVWNIPHSKKNSARYHHKCT
jgi:hypothetical protein